MNNSDAALKSSAKRYCDKIEVAPFYETFVKNLQVLLCFLIVLEAFHFSYKCNAYFFFRM